MSEIMLNEKLICKTSAVNNNCGLNCLTHFLYSKLQSGEAQFIHSDNPDYKALLETFQEYYSLENKLNLDELKKLLDEFNNPIDREIVMAPVLRQHLSKVLKGAAQELYAEAPAAISEYLREGVIEGVSAPLINANKTFFQQLKNTYDQEMVNINHRPVDSYEREVAAQQLKIKSATINEENILDQVLFNRKNELLDSLESNAKAYWFSEGCSNYADYIGNLSKAIEVSADHLTILCQHLSIGVEVYTQDSIDTAKTNDRIRNITHGAQLLPAEEYPWLMRVYNSGIHWEYEEPDGSLIKVREHNQYYQGLNPQNQFNVKAYIDSSAKDSIMATVMHKVDNRAKSVVPTKQPQSVIVNQPKKETISNMRGLRPGTRTPPPKLIEKPKSVEFYSEKIKEPSRGQPILAQARAQYNADFLSIASAKPGPFARAEYERIYNRIERNWDKNKVISDEVLHEATIAQLKIILQSHKQHLKVEHEVWLKENHIKTPHEGKKPPRL